MTRFLARRLLNYIVLLALASFLTFTLTSLNFKPLDSLEQRNPRATAVSDRRQERRTRPRQAHPAAVCRLGCRCGPRRFRHDGHRAAGVRRIAAAHRGDAAALGRRRDIRRCDRRGGRGLGAIRQYRLSDRVITVLSLLVISTPSFVIANMLILAALNVNSLLGVQIFEYTGETAPVPVGGAWDQFVDRLQHLVLPTFTLALMAIAGLAAGTSATRCSTCSARTSSAPHGPRD